MSDDLEQRVYPEDERLRRLQQDPDRRLTRAEWEREEAAARQAARNKHEQVRHDRQVQQESDRKNHRGQRNWGKILLRVGIGFMVLLVIFLLGYMHRHAREKKIAELARQREQEEPKVEVVQVRRTHAPGQLTVPGTTSALTEAYLYARASGYLSKRYVDIGDHVKRGQLMALIDAPDLDQQVAQAREQLRQAEAQQTQQQAQLDLNRVTWERWRTLVARGVFSRQDGDQREADYKTQLASFASARRNVESLRANLERMIALQSYERVTAPFTGIVTERNSDIGALVQASGAAGPAPALSPQAPTGGSTSVAGANTNGSAGVPNQAATPPTGQAQGGPLFGIAQSHVLRILVSVPEGYAPEVHRGMPARVFVQERPGKPVNGKVTRTAGSIDQNTRTMVTEVDIANRDGRLFPGMYAVVSFVQVRGVPPLVIPGDAVVIRQDRPMVAIVRHQRIQMVPIEIGRDYGPVIEVLSGLHEGDLVVVTVTDAVQPGVKVRAVQNPQVAQETVQGGAQDNQFPNSDPGQYGDQSIVNSNTESTNPSRKSGQGRQQPKQSKEGKNGPRK
jgi:multidrug efflux pump subunit AcrA (membrane-fusion protein)